MSDNTTLNNGSGGDVVRDKDRSGTKTQIVGLDIGIGTGSEQLMAPGQAAMAASIPVVLASDQSDVPSNNKPQTSGGLSFSHITAAGSNNKTQVKGSAGQLYAIHAINLSAAVKYIKVFDKASASVTAGTTNADYQFPIPAGGTGLGGGFVMDVDKGVAHANGITVMITGAVALNDNTSVSANDVVCTFFYK